MTRLPPLPVVGGLGSYLREQRENAQMSVRQLSKAAGISNPYLSQIERGLRRPSAEILQALAKGLEISAETLYVQAGLLDGPDDGGTDARAALGLDPRLTARQRRLLIDLYDSFVRPGDASDDLVPGRPSGDSATGASTSDPTTSGSTS